jgi:hypothetical protein
MAVHFHARPEFIGTMWEGIALFNDDGELVAMNRSGQFQLGMNPAHQNIYFEDLFNCRMDALMRQVLARGELLTLHVQSGMRVFAQVRQQEVIRTSGRPEIKAVSKPNHASTALARLNTGDAQMALAIQQVSLVLDQGHSGADRRRNRSRQRAVRTSHSRHKRAPQRPVCRSQLRGSAGRLDRSRIVWV